MCFASLLELQRRVLEGASPSSPEALKAEEDVRSTEKWLKKLRKAEVDYKNRDKSIGKRISKGLFEGKDEVVVVANEQVKSGGISKIQAEATTCGHVVGVSGGDQCVGSGGDSHGSNVVWKEEAAPCASTTSAISSTSTSTSTLQIPPPSSALPVKPAAHIHPILVHMHTHQGFYYLAVFVAAIAVGLKLF